MTSCLFIRIEFNDYFVTVGVIAQLYAILAIYDVLIVNYISNCFNLLDVLLYTQSNVIDQPMLIGKLGIIG